VFVLERVPYDGIPYSLVFTLLESGTNQLNIISLADEAVDVFIQ
jgi:hypothetical protein